MQNFTVFAQIMTFLLSFGVQNTVHNPLKVIYGVTRRDFQATVSFTPEISDGIENVLAENQANCKQHTCSLTNPL